MPSTWRFRLTDWSRIEPVSNPRKASDLEDLQWGLEQVRAGTIKPSLDRVLPLNRAAEAHLLISANKVKGTIALLPWVA